MTPQQLAGLKQLGPQLQQLGQQGQDRRQYRRQQGGDWVYAETSQRSQRGQRDRRRRGGKHECGCQLCNLH